MGISFWGSGAVVVVVSRDAGSVPGGVGSDGFALTSAVGVDVGVGDVELEDEL